METEIYVFTDVDCGYCRKLHSEIENYLKEGIQVNYLAYPREGLESKTYEKMQHAWCSDQPQRSLTSLKSGKTIKIPLVLGSMLQELRKERLMVNLA